MKDTISTIPATYLAKGITSQQWTDWRWQLANSVRRAADLAKYGFSSERITEIHSVVSNTYEDGRDEMRLTPYLLSLIDQPNPHDPIALQHLPRAEEKEPDDFAFEKIWEQKEDFVDSGNRLVQQKYPDIVVLRLSNTCHSFCRFCFEKERTLRHGVPTTVGPEAFAQAVDYIKKDARIRTVLVTGGDPLIAPDNSISERLRVLSAIKHLTSIRLNTRALLHNPFRITTELAAILGNLQKESWGTRDRGIEVRLGVHFNHPRELTPEAIAAIRRLQREGIHIYNQSVVLKGINDRAEIFIDLFRKLREEAVELHYLSHAMTVPRTGHFRTSVRKVQEIMRALKTCKEFRGQLPYAEISHHTGKHLIPDTMHELFYEDVIEKNGRRFPVIRFLSQITGQWEVWMDGSG